MPRVYTQKAAKDYPSSGIKKGDTYFRWKFRGSGWSRALKRPRPSALTRSKWSTVYAARETLEDLGEPGSRAELSALAAAIDDAASNIREVGSEYQDSADAIEIEGSHVKESCEELAEQCEELASEVEDFGQAISALSDEEGEAEEDKEDPVLVEAVSAYEDIMSLDWDPRVGF